MFVNLFENAFTSDYKKLEVENNSSILEIAKNNNLDLENCLIFVNGSQKTSNYILKENDVCTIRQFPGAATVATVLFASVATLVSVELVKGAVSVISGGKYGGEPLINSFLPKSTDVNVANTQQNASMNLPSINGASNQKALGKAIPFIIGKTLFAPYVINDGYTTISDGDGKDKYGGIQTFHCLYLVGYNDLKIENVSLGSHLISSNSENIENGKLKNDGTYFSEADYSPLIEIQQGSNEVSLIPQKVVQTNYNVELLYSVNESLKAYGFSAKYPHKIEFEVQFPNGLYGYDSDGNQIEKTVDIHIQMSIDGGKTWIKTPFTLSHTTDVSSSDETINRITAKHFYTMRLVGVMSISDYDYANSIENHVVQFKVWKTVAKNSENNNDVDNLVFSAIRTWCYNDKESNSSVGLVAQVPMIEKYRDRTCRLGFEIKADTYTSGTLQELNLIATSKAHIWDGIGWSTTTKATNNPASLALLALTKNARGDYSYKTTVQKNYLISDKLDLESFGRLYELCDKNISWTSSKGISYSVKQFECNGAVLNQTKTLDLVNSILRCCRSFITLRGKKYGIFSDVEQENSVLILSNQNVYSRTNSKDFADIPDGFSINFVNALEDYQEDTIIVVPNGVDETNPDLKLEQLEYPYITNAYHVKKEGLYQLRCRNLRREIWNASIGIDGYLVEVGDKVEIQDDTILVGIGDGAEVKDVILDNSNSGILGIKTDAKFHITDLSQTYGIRFTRIVERNGEQVPRVFVKKVTVRETQDNYYDEFYFIDEISLDDESKIEIDDIIVFGIYGKETTEAICFGKKDNGDNSFELTLIPYDKNVYNDSLTKFDYDSKITKYVSEGSVIGLTEESLNERLQKSNSNIQSQISKIKEISSTTISYGVSESDSTEPTTYSDTIPTFLEKGTWLWVKTIITYSDNSTDTLYTKTYIGTDGADGKNGTNGTNGKDGTSVIAQYSVDGSTSWHSAYASGDIFMRTSTDSGATWSSAVRIVGEKGDKGAKGDKGETGATGASGISIKCDTGTLNYTLQRNKKANYESKTFTLALYQGATLLTPTSSSISTANAKNLSVSKSGTTTITITAKSTYNGAIPSGYITATLVYNNVSYSMNIPITTNYNGKYLGLASALPTSANIGDYFVASKTFTASNTTYTQAYVYERVCSAANTYAWIVSTEINSVEVFSDILSLASASNNTQVVAIVQRLVASDIFVNNLSAQKILFQHFVASSSVNNKAKVGDQIISMGYNPKDSSDTDFSFMIQKCIQEANSATGQQEVWMKHFWTKFLASGLLTLNLSGCLQTTGDVKTNPASSLEVQGRGLHQSVSKIINKIYNNTEYIFAGLLCGDIYFTTDYGATWTQCYESSNGESERELVSAFQVSAFCIYNNEIYAIEGYKSSYYYIRLLKYSNSTKKFSVITDGFGENSFSKSLEVYNNKLYIGTNTNLYIYDGTSLEKISFTTVDPGNNIYPVGLFSYRNSLYTITPNTISSLDRVSKLNTVNNRFESVATLDGVLEWPTTDGYNIAIGTDRGYIWFSTDGQNFEKKYIKYSDGTINTGAIYHSYCINNLFIFFGNKKDENENENSSSVSEIPFIATTTDFEKWNVSFISPYYINSLIYSQTKQKWYEAGCNANISVNTEGRGIFCEADYISLANLGAKLNATPLIVDYNLASTGYVKWSNGFLIQWGKITHTSSSNAQWLQATLPISYKSTTSYIGMCSTGLNNDTNAPYAIVNNNNKINEIGIQVRGASSNIRWLTVGYV